MYVPEPVRHTVEIKYKPRLLGPYAFFSVRFIAGVLRAWAINGWGKLGL